MPMQLQGNAPSTFLIRQFKPSKRFVRLGFYTQNGLDALDVSVGKRKRHGHVGAGLVGCWMKPKIPAPPPKSNARTVLWSRSEHRDRGGNPSIGSRLSFPRPESLQVSDHLFHQPRNAE